jgi:hypothetical protein
LSVLLSTDNARRVHSIEKKAARDLRGWKRSFSAARRVVAADRRDVAIALRSDERLAHASAQVRTGSAWAQLTMLVELLLAEQRDPPGRIEVGYPRDDFIVTFWRRRCELSVAGSSALPCVPWYSCLEEVCCEPVT